jgi:hypothetical protein
MDTARVSVGGSKLAAECKAGGAPCGLAPRNAALDCLAQISPSLLGLNLKVHTQDSGLLASRDRGGEGPPLGMGPRTLILQKIDARRRRPYFLIPMLRPSTNGPAGALASRPTNIFLYAQLLAVDLKPTP